MLENDNKMMRIPMQFFADPGAGAGGDPGNNGGDPGNDPGSNPGNDPGSKGGTDKDKTFTQAEVSAMMAAEKSQGKNSILKQLGFDTVDAAKKAIDAYNKGVEDSKTDLQKAQDGLAIKEKEALAIKLEKEKVEQKLNILTLGGNAESLEDIRAITLTKVTEDKTFEKALVEVKEKYPAFFTPSSNSQGTGNSYIGGRKDANGKPQSLGASLASSQKANHPAKSSYFN